MYGVTSVDIKGAPMSQLLERYFHLSQYGTTVRTELWAGLVTFLTMAYIIVVQPAFLSGLAFGQTTGMDAGAVMTATCLSAALGTLIMGLWARYPVALAPGMGQNAFFVLTVIPAAAAAGFEPAWPVALGVVFLAGALFLAVSLVGLRELLLRSVSQSLKSGISAGIGLFIALIGLQNAGLIQAHPATLVTLNSHFTSPDLLVFFAGLIVTAVLYARHISGAILWGIIVATLIAIAFQLSVPAATPKLEQFRLATHIVAMPPSLSPIFGHIDIAASLSRQMITFVVIFLFMDLFDTMGSLIAVGERAGLIQNHHLPRARQAFTADAIATVGGAYLGTSTVTCYIESIAGIEQGGRTGLMAVTVSILFLAALFLHPVVIMIGSYPPITAAALVLVGAMMLQSVHRIEWESPTEAVPAFLILIGIPLTYSISDGIALGFITYPLIKVLAGRREEVSWMMGILAVLLVLYFICLRSSR